MVVVRLEPCHIIPNVGSVSSYEKMIPDTILRVNQTQESFLEVQF